MAPITTLLFDCDNTLVLSESLAFEACADLANEILEARGISDRYTGPQLLSEFVGQNFRGMISSLKSKYNYEMSAAELEGYVSKEEDKVIAKLKAALKPCEGVDEELVRLERKGVFDGGCELECVETIEGERGEDRPGEVFWRSHLQRGDVVGEADEQTGSGGVFARDAEVGGGAARVCGD
ncbi:had superfamily [Botrytis cinerea]